MTGADDTTEAAQSGPPGTVRLTAGLGAWGRDDLMAIAAVRYLD